ncbi:MAG: hypothetical protein ING19_08945 [Azospirillum sp.]|nr:hypothetical protein [Azospirillum sp.]
MTKIVKLTDIVWDTDGEDPEDLGLPNETVIELDDEADPNMEGADALSDKFGYCVWSFVVCKEPSPAPRPGF